MRIISLRKAGSPARKALRAVVGFDHAELRGVRKYYAGLVSAEEGAELAELVRRLKGHEVLSAKERARDELLVGRCVGDERHFEKSQRPQHFTKITTRFRSAGAKDGRRGLNSTPPKFCSVARSLAPPGWE